MITLKRLFRNEYNGEHVSLTRTLKDNAWESNDKYFEFNSEIAKSRAAVVFGNGISRNDFDINLILNHNNGFDNEQRLETYACNAAYRNFKSDFLLINNKVLAEEFVKDFNGASHKNVFANANIVLEYNSFHLIPQNPYMDTGATAAYLAAFNGHKKVFLLGFDGQDSLNVYANTLGYNNAFVENNNNLFASNLLNVFKTYYDTQFIRVMPSANATVHESLKYCLNFKQVNFRDFVIATNL